MFINNTDSNAEGIYASVISLLLRVRCGSFPTQDEVFLSINKLEGTDHLPTALQCSKWSNTTDSPDTWFPLISWSALSPGLLEDGNI